MKRISESGEDLFTQLIAWEMLGRVDLDPQLLLRQVSLADLSVVAATIEERGDRLKDFVSTTLVGLELKYRRGALEGDWQVKREGQCVQLRYSPRSLPSISTSARVIGTGAEV